MISEKSYKQVERTDARGMPLADKAFERSAAKRPAESQAYKRTLVKGPEKSDLQMFMKRFLDVLASGFALLILSPLLLIIACAIKLDSKGPVFFIQKRVGSKKTANAGWWQIKEFDVFKFRTMKNDADESLHKAYIKSFVSGEAEANTEKDAAFKLTADPRITKLGHFLRKTSLDELPQLINVFLGTMSLVGPRPVPVYEVEDYEDWHYQRLAALPGITGLWQVKGRGRVTFEEMIRMDIECIEKQSFFYDLWLLMITIPSVVSQKGAK